MIFRHFYGERLNNYGAGKYFADFMKFGKLENDLLEA